MILTSSQSRRHILYRSHRSDHRLSSGLHLRRYVAFIVAAFDIFSHPSLGRFITGLGVGSVSMVVPLYKFVYIAILG